MRPTALNALFAPVTTLSGIGPKFERLYRRLLDRDEPRVLDLVFHLPTGVVDRRARPLLRDVEPGQIATVLVTVDRHRPPAPGRSRAPYLIYASDGTGDLIITYFKARPEVMEKLLPVGETRWVSGTVATYDGMLQMVHPDRVVTEQDVAKMPSVEPVYPLTEGLSPWGVRRAVEAALTKVPALPEWQDAAFMATRKFPSFGDALRAVHRPSAPDDSAPEKAAWSRLAYDELLAGQLALMMMRARMKKAAGRSTTGDGRIREQLRTALPWTLTASQAKAVEDIAADLEKPERMLRLLQGDVGSGKTVVALFACAAAVEAGSQAALMAPTEILARQHLKTIAPLAEKAGLRVAILTGRERGRERGETLQKLADGEIDILVGTHAIFQDEVAFKDLALAVVDEQHRFGVHQRLALAQKGRAVDVLVMTATPIPRTLVLTYFGDMDVSELREKPAGRKPIDTRTVALDRIDDVVAAVGRAIKEGRQVYWVCPLVEESETIDLAAAQDRFRDLSGVFGEGVVGLVHGKMRGTEKDAAMAKFAAAETMLLVATTVIEVGVDVPRATVMVIEHAERFGLAQLHQLRGRIGRGSEKSTCLLLYKAPLGEAAKARLATMRDTEDGFRIAEEDLKLRGEGDVLGTRQSGLPGFRVARIEVHGELLQAARDDAKLIMERDGGLDGERGAALRTLLYLFGRDEAMRLIRAG